MNWMGGTRKKLLEHKKSAMVLLKSVNSSQHQYTKRQLTMQAIKHTNPLEAFIDCERDELGNPIKLIGDDLIEFP